MDEIVDQPAFRFEIKPIIEQTPFTDPAVQAFFSKWCEINDSIVPSYLAREPWEQGKAARGVLQKNPDGTSTLIIPTDLHLWEMIDIMETVDKDTFSDSEKEGVEKGQKIRELGRMFQMASIYMAKRLDTITQGRSIAERLATDFYRYGTALT